MKTEREISSGGVIYKQEDGKTKIALIARKNKTIWCLPKGKIEKGENPESAAIREVEEETGLKGELGKKIGDINYWYVDKKRDLRLFKIVSFFLVRHTGGDIHSHDREVEECRWFSFEEAQKKMSYDSEREIVKKAENMLEL